MNNQYYIGMCMICHQGMLEIVKEKSSGKLFVVCDECEVEWENPDNALKKLNGTRDRFDTAVKVSLSDIQRLHWETYLEK